jgi:hypothetical protein
MEGFGGKKKVLDNPKLGLESNKQDYCDVLTHCRMKCRCTPVLPSLTSSISVAVAKVTYEN